jgi:hypothetical protein
MKETGGRLTRLLRDPKKARKKQKKTRCASPCLLYGLMYFGRIEKQFDFTLG